MIEDKIKAIEFSKFDGIANKTTFSEIKTHLFSCKQIELFPNELVVRLDIPWGELYCVCTNEEWNELYQILNNNNIKISKRKFLDSVLDVLNFFFVQPIEWLSDLFKKNRDR